MPEEIKPEETPEAKPDETTEKPQAPVVTPPVPSANKETTPPVPSPEKPAQGRDDATAKTEAAEKEAAEARAKAAALELELNRERMARKYGLPDELMSMLRSDSLEADAKALSQHITHKGSVLGTGGLDPTDNDDPKAEGEALADRLFSANRYF
ncbi:hypothetical protein [Streptomyces spectabilis]|uniref:Scaffolding protein n=1 Tax=Streptomyces spectabilis TaxID=68270 RepID=A0A516RF89_STRST|nr:hypothetical protein [Streptomyces spectabilis]QDQ14327.1 hypothetical protein FH965_30255 [Streptomyces spectabilis]